jgi:hypothetical protein
MLTSAPVGCDSKFTFWSGPHISEPQPVNSMLTAQQPMIASVELVSFIIRVLSDKDDVSITIFGRVRSFWDLQTTAQPSRALRHSCIASSVPTFRNHPNTDIINDLACFNTES